jgi:hypothetical protein
MTKYNKDELKKIVEKSFSIAEVCRKLNIIPAGGNYKSLKVNFLKFDIDTSHFTGQGWNFGANFKKFGKCFTLDEILVKNSTYTNTTNIKKKLFEAGLKENICEECGTNIWNNKPITLQLHHKDGDNTNNKLDNLKILCPNCHTQTDTYGSKNKGIEKTYNKIQLLEAIYNSKNYSEVKIKIGLKRGGDNNVIKNIMFEYDIIFKDSEKIKNIILKEKELIEKILIENNTSIEKEEKVKKEKIKNYCSCGKEIDKRSKSCQKCNTDRYYKVKNRPTKDELRLMISETSLESVGRVYGVCGKSIKKWLK